MIVIIGKILMSPDPSFQDYRKYLCKPPRAIEEEANIANNDSASKQYDPLNDTIDYHR